MNSASKHSQVLIPSIIFLDSVMDYGKKIDIFQYSKPDKDQFMVIELLGMPVGKTLHVIKLNDSSVLKLVRFPLSLYLKGRGHDADVRVADISVSRHHANIKYDKESNSIIMQDH